MIYFTTPSYSIVSCIDKDRGTGVKGVRLRRCTVVLSGLKKKGKNGIRRITQPWTSPAMELSEPLLSGSGSRPAPLLSVGRSSAAASVSTPRDRCPTLPPAPPTPPPSPPPSPPGSPRMTRASASSVASTDSCSSDTSSLSSRSSRSSTSGARRTLPLLKKTSLYSLIVSSAGGGGGGDGDEEDDYEDVRYHLAAKYVGDAMHGRKVKGNLYRSSRELKSSIMAEVRQHARLVAGSLWFVGTKSWWTRRSVFSFPCLGRVGGAPWLGHLADRRDADRGVRAAVLSRWSIKRAKGKPTVGLTLLVAGGGGESHDQPLQPYPYRKTDHMHWAAVWLTAKPPPPRTGTTTALPLPPFADPHVDATVVRSVTGLTGPCSTRSPLRFLSNKITLFFTPTNSRYTPTFHTIAHTICCTILPPSFHQIGSPILNPHPTESSGLFPPPTEAGSYVSSSSCTWCSLGL